ncbi:MAG: hypothetical protein JSS36_07395 [Proteobacteria bacterium]|nr:hypothetical protein [Pseudomonadota bacterium]
MAHDSSALTKVPAVTLGFWAIKVLATTLGETAGDAVSMSWLGETTASATGWGYLIGTVILTVPLVLLVLAQVRSAAYSPALYWATIIASTTAGTTMADFTTRSLFARMLHLDQTAAYAMAALLLLAMVLASLWVWRRTLGTVSVASVASPRAEMFYWLTITLSQTLGTALGDWTADSFGEAQVMGLESAYVLGALVFAGVLAGVALLHRFTRISPTALFWAAFILTRPLGATVGDFLTKPLGHGGLDLARPMASLVLMGLIIAGLALNRRRKA